MNGIRIWKDEGGGAALVTGNGILFQFLVFSQPGIGKVYLGEGQEGGKGATSLRRQKRV